MFHGGIHSYYVPGFPDPIGWILVGVILLFIFGVRFYKAKTGRKETSGLTDEQKATLDNFEAQVNALLHQHGGSLPQTEIRNFLDLPPEIVAEKLLALEKEGTIERKWLNEQFTFRVLSLSKKWAGNQ